MRSESELYSRDAAAMLLEDIISKYCTTCQHSRRAFGLWYYWCAKDYLDVASAKWACDLYRPRDNHRLATDN